MVARPSQNQSNMKSTEFKGKVAIITGSSQGIGKATAIALCKQGASVVLNGRNTEKLYHTEAELRRMGYTVHAVQGDITSIEDCQRLVNETLVHFGRLDILINNGSLTMQEKITRIEPEVFAQVHTSNSLGAVYPTLAALPHLQASGGSIILISSLAGLHGMPSAAAYSMGKMALTAWWQSLKIELRQTPIHVGICYLGFTENEAEKRMVTAEGKLIPVPRRPAFFQQSREKVAAEICAMIRYKKSKLVLSPLGKITAWMIRFFPRTVLSIFQWSQRRKFA
jgi:short-subunit dehydrogenase